MADPFSALMLTVGTGMSALGSIRQGQAAEASANYNAEMAQIESASQALQTRRRGAAYTAAARAARAKSGVTSEGTPLLAIAESAANAELDALNAEWSGRAQTSLYKAQGKNAKQAGYMSAGTSLLTGASKLF